MKNVFLLVGMLSVMASCGPNYKQQVLDLQLKHDSLLSAYNLKEDELVGYMKDLNDIQTSINELTEQEQLLQKSSEGELNADAKTRILNNLDAIRSALESNKKKLASVQAKLKKSNAKIAELETMIANLNNDIAMRDSSIALLSQTVTELSNKINLVETDMAAVKTDNENKAKEIADKTTKLNTAYYTIGSYKSLREKKVISNEGKIFKSKDVDPNFDTNAFTRIDVTNTKIITLNYVKDAKVVTTHPTDSYTMVKENDRIKGIEVTNPERFWASSKYLVVVAE